MKKEYILTFCISLVSIVVVFIILLMIMLPQQVQLVQGNINKYEAITKSEYTFESTKDINSDSLVKQYTITDTDMNRFRNNNQYRPGNSDPFSPTVSPTTEATSSGTTSSSSGSSTGSTSSSSSSSSSNDTVTQDRTTNSNDGVANPPSTSK